MIQAEKLPHALREKFLKSHSREPVGDAPKRWIHLWHWFLELSEGRGEGFSGPAPITHETIFAWRNNSGARPRPIEVRLIFAMDLAWRSEIYRLQKLKTPKV